jgi:hypothetical protein
MRFRKPIDAKSAGRANEFLTVLNCFIVKHITFAAQFFSGFNYKK